MDTLLQHLQFVRGVTLMRLQKVEKGQEDIQPAAFSNTLRWNFAHILTPYEAFVFGLSGKESNLDPKYKELFGRGTRPSEWTVVPPSMKEIAKELDTQGKLIIETFHDSLDEKLLKPFDFSPNYTFETVRDALTACIWHEGLHLGVINGLMRVVTKNNS